MEEINKDSYCPFRKNMFLDDICTCAPPVDCIARAYDMSLQEIMRILVILTGI